jgi:hypothetical protein
MVGEAAGVLVADTVLPRGIHGAGAIAISHSKSSKEGVNRTISSAIRIVVGIVHG